MIGFLFPPHYFSMSRDLAVYKLSGFGRNFRKIYAILSFSWANLVKSKVDHFRYLNQFCRHNVSVLSSPTLASLIEF